MSRSAPTSHRGHTEWVKRCIARWDRMTVAQLSAAAFDLARPVDGSSHRHQKRQRRQLHYLTVYARERAIGLEGPSCTCRVCDPNDEKENEQ